MRYHPISMPLRMIAVFWTTVLSVTFVKGDTYQYISQLGRTEPVQWFSYPSGICIGNQDRLFVVDTGNPRLYKFTPEGTPDWDADLKAYSIKGPSEVASSQTGDLFVVDVVRKELVRLDASGRLLSRFTWPNAAAEDAPAGCVIDSQGYVYLAEMAGAKIHKFTPSGVWISSFGVEGQQPGQLRSPCGLAIDSAGVLFVADSTLNKIQKFDLSGNYLNWFCGSDCPEYDNDPPAGEFGRISSVGIGSDGKVFVCDLNACLIDKFQTDGTYIGRFGGEGLNDQQFVCPTELATCSSGVWVTDRESRLVKKMDKDTGNCLVKIGSSGTLQDELLIPERLTIDSSGNIYVVDRGNCRIAKFLTDGSVTTFGSRGSGNGEFYQPCGISLDNTGQFLYVTDMHNRRVQKFTLGGTYVSTFGQFGQADGLFLAPCGISVDGNGNVYVTDTGKGNIQKFTSDGIYQMKFGDGSLSSPESCALDSSGNIYVTDSGHNLIKKYDSSGGLLSSFGGDSSTEDGSFQYPIDLKLGPDGHLFVVEHYGDCRIQEFDSSGTFIGRIRGINTGTSDFDRASGLAISSSGNLYVSDTGNHKIAKLSTSVLPCIDHITATDFSTSGGTIRWMTQSPATSKVTYWLLNGQPSQVEDQSAVTNHSVTLSGLQGDAMYSYKVSSTDGNGTSESGVLEFLTLPTTGSVEAENSVDVGYGGDWSKTPDANAVLGAYAHSSDTTAPAKLYLNYTGTGVTVRYIGLPTGGRAKYYLDGYAESSGEIDFYASTTTYNQFVSISGQAFGKHKLAIKWHGSSTGGGNTLAVDRFDVVRN